MCEFVCCGKSIVLFDIWNNRKIDRHARVFESNRLHQRTLNRVRRPLHCVGKHKKRCTASGISDTYGESSPTFWLFENTKPCVLYQWKQDNRREEEEETSISFTLLTISVVFNTTPCIYCKLWLVNCRRGWNSRHNYSSKHIIENTFLWKQFFC